MSLPNPQQVLSTVESILLAPLQWLGIVTVTQPPSSGNLVLQAQLPNGTLTQSPTYSIGDNVVFVFTLQDSLAKQTATVQWFSNNPSITGLVHPWDYAATGDNYYDAVGVANAAMQADSPVQIYGVVTLTNGQTITSNTITFNVIASAAPAYTVQSTTGTNITGPYPTLAGAENQAIFNAGYYGFPFEVIDNSTGAVVYTT